MVCSEIEICVVVVLEEEVEVEEEEEETRRIDGEKRGTISFID